MLLLFLIYLLLNFEFKIQEGEKEKLTLVASEHLDRIVTVYPTLREHIGVEIQPDSDYVSSRIKQVEALISQHLENIQVEKCELL